MFVEKTEHTVRQTATTAGPQVSPPRSTCYFSLVSRWKCRFTRSKLTHQLVSLIPNLWPTSTSRQLSPLGPASSTRSSPPRPQAVRFPRTLAPVGATVLSFFPNMTAHWLCSTSNLCSCHWRRSHTYKPPNPTAFTQTLDAVEPLWRANIFPPVNLGLSLASLTTCIPWVIDFIFFLSPMKRGRAWFTGLASYPLWGIHALPQLCFSLPGWWLPNLLPEFHLSAVSFIFTRTWLLNPSPGKPKFIIFPIVVDLYWWFAQLKMDFLLFGNWPQSTGKPLAAI